MERRKQTERLVLINRNLMVTGKPNNKSLMRGTYGPKKQQLFLEL